jgi:hypothetical protein
MSPRFPLFLAVFRTFGGSSSQQLRPWHGPLRIFRNELLEGLQVRKGLKKGLVDGRFELIVVANMRILPAKWSW